MKFSTKGLLAAVGLVSTLLQVQQVREDLLAFASVHPAYAGIVAFALGSAALLHNPEVQKACGIEGE